MENLSRIKVVVKSLVPQVVTYSNEFRHVRRQWSRQNQEILIPADELQESIYDKGVYNLFNLGYLGIDNAEHRKLIGLDTDYTGKVEPFSREDAKELLFKEADLATFRQKISELKSGNVDVLVEEAFAVRNVSYDKINIIKEILGIDITSMLNNDKDPAKKEDK